MQGTTTRLLRSTKSARSRGSATGSSSLTVRPAGRAGEPGGTVRSGANSNPTTPNAARDCIARATNIMATNIVTDQAKICAIVMGRLTCSAAALRRRSCARHQRRLGEPWRSLANGLARAAGRSA